MEWSGNDIKVLNRVLVHPPYTSDSIEPIGDISDMAVASAKEHVRKIVRVKKILGLTVIGAWQTNMSDHHSSLGQKVFGAIIIIIRL